MLTLKQESDSGFVEMIRNQW